MTRLQEINIMGVRGANGEPRGGVISALVIPTDKVGNVIDGALKRNIEWLKTKGIGGLMVLGSTGEFLKFDEKQRVCILESIAEINGGDFPMIANCTADTVREVSRLSRAAEKNGFNGISLMPQYFYPQSQADMLEFFLRCDSSYSLPTLLYNFPERTGTRIGEAVVDEFAQKGKMFGIKQSGSEFEYHKRLIELGERNGFSVFSGFDTRLPEVFSMGAAGCIGGLVNIVPEYMSQIYKICKQGEKGDLQMLAERVAFVGRTIDKATFPINVQFGMLARGLEVGEPKMSVSAKTDALREEIVATLKAAFKDWGLLP